MDLNSKIKKQTTGLDKEEIDSVSQTSSGKHNFKIASLEYFGQIQEEGTQQSREKTQVVKLNPASKCMFDPILDMIYERLVRNKLGMERGNSLQDFDKSNKKAGFLN